MINAPQVVFILSCFAVLRQKPKSVLSCWPGDPMLTIEEPRDFGCGAAASGTASLFLPDPARGGSSCTGGWWPPSQLIPKGQSHGVNGLCRALGEPWGFLLFLLFLQLDRRLTCRQRH